MQKIFDPNYQREVKVEVQNQQQHHQHQSSFSNSNTNVIGNVGDHAQHAEFGSAPVNEKHPANFDRFSQSKQAVDQVMTNEHFKTVTPTRKEQKPTTAMAAPGNRNASKERKH